MNPKQTLAAAAAAALLAATSVTGAAAPALAQTQAQRCTPSWQLVQTPPLPGPLGSELGAPAVVSRTDIWFPSDTGSGPVPDFHAAMLHWDGKSVTAAPEPVTQPLMVKSTDRASFDSSTDGWVIGGINSTKSEGNPGQAYFAHWDGSRWTIMPFLGPQDQATVEGHRPGLADVAAVSPTDAWAVGTMDVDLGGNGHGVFIEHWDGSTWSVVPNPASDPSLGGRLDTLKVISPDDVYAVGRQRDSNGTTIPLVEHWDGKAWNIVPVPAAGSFSALTAISASSPNDIWVAGDQLRPGTTNIAAPFIEHWDGTSWQVASLPDLGANGARATGIYAASPTDVWVTNLTPLQEPGEFLHWDGTNWTTVQTPGPQELDKGSSFSGIAGTGPTDIWASGSEVSLSSGNQALIAHLTCG